MRVIGNFPHPACKITLFDWNQKYLIKFEHGPFEQTFKVSHLDVASEEELRELIRPEFIERTLARFQSMAEDFRLLV